MDNAEPATRSRGEADSGRILIILAALCWSLAGIFIKLLDLHPLVIIFYRSFFASLVFVPFLKRAQFRLNGAVIISAISYTAAISAFVSANKLTTAANAIVLQYTAPVFVFLFARLVLGERITPLNGFTLVLSMTGVGIIAFESIGQPEMAGVLLAILSGVLFAVFMVNLQRVKDISLVYLTGLNNFICAALLLPFVSAQIAISVDQLGILALMGTLQLGLPYFLFSKGLQTIPLQEAALIALIEPVLNPLWVALTFGEIPSSATLAGGGTIIIALAIRYFWPLLGGTSIERA